MEKIRLRNLPSSFKFLLTIYFLLVSIGFLFAALMSHERVLLRSGIVGTLTGLLARRTK